MIETGNYIDIRIQEKTRYKKPVGIYWLQAASAYLFSSQHLNEIWAYRLPSLASAVLAVLLTATLGSYLFSPLTGCIAAIMMIASIALNVEARLAKTDAALLACVLTVQLALAKAWMGTRNRPDSHSAKATPSWQNAVMFWSALSAGFLIKGPVIVLIIGLTLLGLYFSEPKKQRTMAWFKSLRPLPGMIGTSLLIMPWLVAITLQSNGAYLEQAVSHDFLAKFWQGQERGALIPGLHLAVFPIMFFPFSLLTALATPLIWQRRKDAPVRFCLSWILPTWGIFELSMTKLPHYLLPVYPAIAILTSAAITAAPPQPSSTPSQTRTILFGLAASLWLILGSGLALLSNWMPFALNETPSLWQGATGAMLILAQGISLLFLLQKKILASVMSLAAGQMVFLGTLASLTAPGLQHVWLSRDLVQAADKLKPCGKLRLISASYNEPSLVFLAGTKTEILPNGKYAAKNLEKNPCAVAVIDQDHKKNFEDSFTSRNRKPALKTTVEGRNPANGDRKILSLYAYPVQTGAEAGTTK